MILIPRFGDVVVVHDDTERAVEIELETVSYTHLTLPTKRIV